MKRSSFYRRFALILAAVLLTAPLYLHAQSDDASSVQFPPCPPGASYITNDDGSLGMVPDSGGGTVAASGGGFFANDDSSGPPVPEGGPEGGSPGSPFIPVDPGTNLYLYIYNVEGSALIMFSNCIVGLPYQLLATPDLTVPITNWTPVASFIATNTTNWCPPLPMNSQFVAFEGVQETPGNLRWKTFLDDDNPFAPKSIVLLSTPSLSPDGNHVYAMTIAQNVYSLNFQTGTIEWSTNIFNDQFFSNAGVTPQEPEYTASVVVSADGSKLLTGSVDGHAYCLAPNGNVNWSASLGHFSSAYNCPAWRGSQAYFPIDETLANRQSNPVTGLMCLNTTETNCSTNFFFQPTDLFYGNAGDLDSAPAIDGSGNTYFVTEGHRLYCVSPQGFVRWYLPLPGDAEPDSSIALAPNGMIIVGANSNPDVSAFFPIYAVHPDGTLAWTLNLRSPVIGSPIIDANGVIYVMALTSFNVISNGLLLTNFSLSAGSPGAPVLGADGSVFFADQAGNVWHYQNGALTNFAQLDSSLGAVGSVMLANDGTVLVPCADGNLYAFWGTTPFATNSPWPCFHHDQQLSGVQSNYLPDFTDPAPAFLSDGTNDGGGDFIFSVVGPTNTTFEVFTSTNLANWTDVGSILLTNESGITNTTANAILEDNAVAGLSQKYYQLVNSNGCSDVLGFVNLTIATGSNLVSDPFYQVDDGTLFFGFDPDPQVLAGPFFPMNSLSALFRVFDDWGENENGVEALEWDGTGFDGDIFIPFPVPGWQNGGTNLLLPGRSLFVVNTNAPFPVLLSGRVREQQMIGINAQTNFLSATAPLTGAITNVTGYVPAEDDMVQLWNPTNQAFTSHTFHQSSGWVNGVPVLSVGQGFVLITTNFGTWTNTFTNGFCGSP